VILSFAATAIETVKVPEPSAQSTAVVAVSSEQVQKGVATPPELMKLMTQEVCAPPAKVTAPRMSLLFAFMVPAPHEVSVGTVPEVVTWPVVVTVKVPPSDSKSTAQYCHGSISYITLSIIPVSSPKK